MKKKILALSLLIVASLCVFMFGACGEKEVAVESVVLNKTQLTIAEGEQEVLNVTVNPDSATDKTVKWSTSDSAIVTVADGKVTAVRAGEATVSVEAGGKTATCAVTVTEKIIDLAGKVFVYKAGSAYYVDDSGNKITGQPYDNMLLGLDLHKTNETVKFVNTADGLNVVYGNLNSTDEFSYAVTRDGNVLVYTTGEKGSHADYSVTFTMTASESKVSFIITYGVSVGSPTAVLEYDLMSN